MKLAVEFPSVSYREGPEAVMRLARAIERIGYDHIDIFDHVIMGIPIEGRPKGPYNPGMPILEAFMALAYLAAVTTRVTLGTEVLVLPQRQPALVAKQVSTLDTLHDKTVYLVDCRFDDSDVFLQQMQAWFAEHMPAVKTIVKPISSVYLKDDPATWQEIKARGHAAIVGVGH